MPFRETRTVHTPFQFFECTRRHPPLNLSVKVVGAGGNNLF